MSASLWILDRSAESNQERLGLYLRSDCNRWIQYYIIPVVLKCSAYRYTNLCAPEYPLGRLPWIHQIQNCLQFLWKHRIPLPVINYMFYNGEDLLHKIKKSFSE